MQLTPLKSNVFNKTSPHQRVKSIMAKQNSSKFDKQHNIQNLDMQDEIECTLNTQIDTSRLRKELVLINSSSSFAFKKEEEKMCSPQEFLFGNENQNNNVQNTQQTNSGNQPHQLCIQNIDFDFL
ncbi:Hypothetical_protein [Hexamita inflata]|uniref:Hypothetical_protein n=1 Tax=Hexamita inflata TaxID=28002 RepID=A0AA86U8I4_9EUKA|nr:Hypothetical protein HINF_LOCUS30751 [Hexamita inflata]